MFYLAEHFGGKIAFRYADFMVDENFRMTYDVYNPGKSFYIDEEGKVYGYPGIPNLKDVKHWIEERKYTSSPL